MKPDTKLYLVPNTLGEYPPSVVLSENTLSIIRNLDTFIVENSKSARAFLKACEILKPQNELTILELDKHNPDEDLSHYLKPLQSGVNTGLLSEAGVPAVADPGARIVKRAHALGIRVVPLTGPSSILLALMASGLDGQRFSFHGYLPIDKQERIRFLQHLEKDSIQFSRTQIFIETPYRNNQLLKDLCEILKPEMRICIAVNITLPDENIRTLTVKEWRKSSPDLHKKPVVFCIGQ